MKYRFKEKQICVPIYSVKVKFAWTNNMVKYCKRYDITGVEKYDGLVTSIDNDDVVLMVLNVKADLSVLFHEIIHVKNDVFKIVGIELDLDNDEAEAYLVSFLSEKAISFYTGLV